MASPLTSPTTQPAETVMQSDAHALIAKSKLLRSHEDEISSAVWAHLQRADNQANRAADSFKLRDDVITKELD
jgi:hypothetical protein